MKDGRWGGDHVHPAVLEWWLTEVRVETNARALMDVVRSVPGTRHLCLEEVTLSGSPYEVLEPHVRAGGRGG